MQYYVIWCMKNNQSEWSEKKQGLLFKQIFRFVTKKCEPNFFQIDDQIANFSWLYEIHWVKLAIEKLTWQSAQFLVQTYLTQDYYLKIGPREFYVKASLLQCIWDVFKKMTIFFIYDY